MVTSSATDPMALARRVEEPSTASKAVIAKLNQPFWPVWISPFQAIFATSAESPAPFSLTYLGGALLSTISAAAV
jgi:hypothetical protein